MMPACHALSLPLALHALHSLLAGLEPASHGPGAPDAHSCPLAPPTCRRLCKLKYYNNCLFYNVQRNFIAQSGDPTNTGKGGESVWGVLYGEQVRRVLRCVTVNDAPCMPGCAAVLRRPCLKALCWCAGALLRG